MRILRRPGLEDPGTAVGIRRHRSIEGLGRIINGYPAYPRTKDRSIETFVFDSQPQTEDQLGQRRPEPCLVIDIDYPIMVQVIVNDTARPRTWLGRVIGHLLCVLEDTVG